MTVSATPAPAHRSPSRARFRPAIALALLIVWPVVPITGLVAHAVRDIGGRPGMGPLTEVHWWLGIVAVAITIVHLVVNWPIVKGQLGRLLR